MGIIDSGLKYFGITIQGKKEDENLSSALAVADDGDGAVLAAAHSGAASYGIYLDIDGNSKNDILLIQKYRDISLYPEIDIAIQDIINEAIPQEWDSEQISLILDDLEISDQLKNQIQAEFDIIVKRLDYSDASSDLFRRWYIDGRLFFQVIVDKNNPSRGIQDMILIDAAKIRKIKEIKKKKTESGVDAIDSVEEYYVFNEAGFNINQTTGQFTNKQGVKIAADSIVYVPSGYIDHNSGIVLSHLNKAIRPANQLRMLEDATVVYFIARAPERRIFYVDVGNLPKLKAESYIKDMMNRYRNKMVYDGKTGEVKDDKKYMSMLEDYWMPRGSGGKSTEVTTLEGASNITGMLDNVEYFKKKLYQSLNIPIARIQPETGFSLGRSTEISRDELKFQKYIDRLRNKFAQLFFETLRIQLILKGVVNTSEWEDVKEKIRFKFQTDNYFTEMKRLDMLQARMSVLPTIDPYMGRLFSKKYVQKNVLGMNEEEIQIMEDEISSETDDPAAQSLMVMQMDMQQQAQMDMMNAQQEMQPPVGQPQSAPVQQTQGQPKQKQTNPVYDSNNYQS